MPSSLRAVRLAAMQLRRCVSTNRIGFIPEQSWKLLDAIFKESKASAYKAEVSRVGVGLVDYICSNCSWLS